MENNFKYNIILAVPFGTVFVYNSNLGIFAHHCDYKVVIAIIELVIARVAFATRGNLIMVITTLNPHCHCEALKKPWQSQYSNYYTQQTIVIAKAEGLWQSQYEIQLLTHGILFSFL